MIFVCLRLNSSFRLTTCILVTILAFRKAMNTFHIQRGDFLEFIPILEPNRVLLLKLNKRKLLLTLYRKSSYKIWSNFPLLNSFNLKHSLKLNSKFFLSNILVKFYNFLNRRTKSTALFISPMHHSHTVLGCFVSADRLIGKLSWEMSKRRYKMNKHIRLETTWTVIIKNGSQLILIVDFSCLNLCTIH